MQSKQLFYLQLLSINMKVLRYYFFRICWNAEAATRCSMKKVLKARIHCETFLSEYFMKYSFRGISWNMKYVHEIGKKYMWLHIFRTAVNWQIPALSSNECYIILYYWSYIDFYTFITYAFCITFTYNYETCIHGFIIYWFLKFTALHVFCFY